MSMYKPRSDVIILERVERPKNVGNIIVSQEDKDVYQYWFKVLETGAGATVDEQQVSFITFFNLYVKAKVPFLKKGVYISYCMTMRFRLWRNSDLQYKSGSIDGRKSKRAFL